MREGALAGWPNFLQLRNLPIILMQQSYTGIIVLGMTFIIIFSGIYLSIGSMVAFMGGVAVFLLKKFPSDSFLGVFIALLFALPSACFADL
jgi:ribose transport system permease protein